MQKTIRLKLTLYILISISHLLFSDSLVRFNPFTVPQSDRTLTQINCIYQDSRGYLWIGEEGLFRYDGYELKHFVFDANDPQSIPSNLITAITEDPSGRLWFGTRYGHVFSYSHKTGIFSPITIQLPDDIPYRHSRINALFFDSRDTLWIGTTFNGLISFHVSSGKIKKHYNKSSGLYSNIVYTIYQNRRKEILIGTKDGLYKIGVDRKLINYFDKTDFPENLSKIFVTALYEDSKSQLWVGTNRGVIILNPVNKNLIHLSHNTINTNSLSNNFVTSIVEGENGRIWIGTLEGLNRLQSLKKGLFDIFNFEPGNPYTIPDSIINRLICDHSGILWIATENGICQYKKLLPITSANSLFINQKLGTDRKITLAAEDRDGLLWLATGKALYKFDKQKKSLKAATFLGDIYLKNYRQTFHIYSRMIDDGNGYIWISSLKYLIKFNKKNRSHAKYDISRIVSIHQDREQNLWFGSLDRGLVFHDIKKRKFKYYSKYNSQISSSNVMHVYPDKMDPNRLWIGFTNSGIDLFLKKEQRFEHHPFVKNDGSPLRFYVTSLNISKKMKNILWISTANCGLIKYDYQNKKASYYSERNGLLTNFLNGAVEDRQGNLWLSTGNRGISQLKIRPQRWLHFSNQDGLFNQRYFHKVIAKGNSGEIYIGGYEGLDIIDPKKIGKNIHIPKIMISDIRIFDRDNRLIRYEHNRADIALDYDESIKIKMAVSDFHNPDKNRFAYKLNGYNEDWIQTSAGGRELTYMNLPPGTYLLEMKGANNHEIWSSDTLSIQMTIKPPYWGTWWFRLILTMLFFAGLFFWHNKRMQRQARKLKTENALDKFCIKFSITNREQEIIKLILLGMSNREIEEELYIAAGTVRNHIYSIFKKFNIKSRVQLITLFKAFEKK